jgi:5-methyltetrahydropteroyltriglutamate--homocysteine methyltransferase
LQAFKKSSAASASNASNGIAAGLPLYFALARGAEGATACDMSKHFDSNYHHLVPELDASSGEQARKQALLAAVRRSVVRCLIAVLDCGA